MIAAMVLAAVSAAAPLLPAAAPVPVSGAFVRPGAAASAAAVRPAVITVRAIDHNGSRASYRGVRLADLLRARGVPVGGAVRGDAARAYVRVSAYDGYAAIFTLAELQTADSRCAPIVADARNGLRLPPGTGPVRIVAPCDRMHARWVRGVTKLTVIVAPKS
jgi:hypothetical protein